MAIFEGGNQEWFIFDLLTFKLVNTIINEIAYVKSLCIIQITKKVIVLVRWSLSSSPSPHTHTYMQTHTDIKEFLIFQLGCLSIYSIHSTTALETHSHPPCLPWLLSLKVLLLSLSPALHPRTWLTSCLPHSAQSFTQSTHVHLACGLLL
jgi:hypothetical protein